MSAITLRRFLLTRSRPRWTRKSAHWTPLTPSVIDKVLYDKGIRFVFSTRSKVPWILKEDGSKFYDSNYKFVPGKDEVIRKGTAGYIVSYGDMLYRSLDAVERLKKEGVDVGLINKVTLNVIDEQVLKEIGSTKFVLVAESLNQKTGLGSKVGTTARV